MYMNYNKEDESTEIQQLAFPILVSAQQLSESREK